MAYFSYPSRKFSRDSFPLSAWSLLTYWDFHLKGNIRVFGQSVPLGGYIGRTFNNVSKVELLEVIIPNCVDYGDHIDNYPYIILDIEELGDTYNGTNT